MFKAVIWLYGIREIEEFETKEEAMSFGEYGADQGLCFFECVLDEDDIVVYDGKSNVIIENYESELGKRYIFE